MFKVAFGSYSAAARHFNVSRMTLWRWRHEWAPIPKVVAEKMKKLVHEKVVEAHEAEVQLRDFLALPPKPERPLSGCCAGRHRRPKRLN
jgi:transposase-like protein